MHDYGKGFTKATLKLLPTFIVDATKLAEMIEADTMADRLHLSARRRRVLEALLQEHLPDVEVWGYGSRVNGRSHNGSDLDLVLRGPGLKEILTDLTMGFEKAVQGVTIPLLVEGGTGRYCRNGFSRKSSGRM